MDTIIKTFLGTFFFLLLLFLGAGLIAASVDARNADAYLAMAVSEIEASNCATSVIDEWETRAMDKDYVLAVTDITHADTSEKRYATASLSYVYRLPLIGFEKRQTIRANVR